MVLARITEVVVVCGWSRMEYTSYRLWYMGGRERERDFKGAEYLICRIPREWEYHSGVVLWVWVSTGCTLRHPLVPFPSSLVTNDVPTSPTLFCSLLKSPVIWWSRHKRSPLIKIQVITVYTSFRDYLAGRSEFEKYINRLFNWVIL